MDYSKLHTPCYIFDENEFAKNLFLFKKSLNKYFGEKAIIGYSFKTNSLPYLVNCAKKYGCYAEIVSDTEYDLALMMGFTPEHIIYNGPIKTKDTFIEVVMSGGIVNIDSFREIEWLKEIEEDQVIKNVGLRVNFDIESILPFQTTMGNNGGRFGFCDENGMLEDAINKLQSIRNVKIIGLHMHISSKSKSQDIYRELAKRACQIAQREKLDLNYIDIGGGFFGGGDDGSAYENYLKFIHDVFVEFSMSNIILIVEPGASVVATSFEYIVEVIDTKETTLNCFVVTNGSRLHIDPFFNRKNHMITYHATQNNKMNKQIICGYTCMENDRFMEVVNESQFTIGDKIHFHNVGSYTMCFNSLFIRYLPRVYVKKDGEYQEVRKQWGIEEYIQKNIWK
jgi:diaminopimelate decarboxylase